MPDSSTPFLLILKNGPIHAIDDYVGYQLEVLSREFQGEMWVTGSFEANLEIGRFRAHVVKEPDHKGMSFIRAYYRRVLARARELDATITAPKVVITYDPFRNGLLGTRVKRRLNWPLIVEVNGMYGDPDNFIDSSGVFATRIKPYLFGIVGRHVLRKADGVRLLFNEQLAGFAPQPRKAIVKQYFDGVPLDRFTPAPAEKFVLSAGFPFYRKGIDLLLDAYAQVHAEFPDWKLLIIGHDLARHIPVVPPYAEVLRAVPNRELAQLMRRCGVLVLASRSEAMGRVLIEAGAAAKPRLVAAVGGTYTVVESDKDGILFPKGDVAALAAGLRKLMGDEALRQQLGNAALERTLVEFGADSYLRHVSNFVDEVLRKRQG
jgi:glycosyltransferase involved in cell wall biosynthesis